MKKIIVIGVIIAGITLLPLITSSRTVLAQEETAEEEVLTTTEDQNLDTFDLGLTTGVQSIFDKSLPINLKITSNIKSERMQVRWKLPTGMKTKGTYTSAWTTIEKGDVLETMTTVIPSKPGTYNLIAEVQAWQAEANYVDTVAISLTFDNNLEIQPQSEEYYRNERSWLWAKIGMGIVAVTLIGIIGYLGFKAFQKWMDED